MYRRTIRNQKSGFTLVTVTIGILVMIGMVGLAIDLGRMYIVKGETQTFVDSASLAATLELDGTADGLSRAHHAFDTACRNVHSDFKRWAVSLRWVAL